MEFKEGEIYICTEQYNNWFTIGHEYPVSLNPVDNTFVIQDDEGNKWTYTEVTWSLQQFKLKKEKQMEEPPMEKELASDLIDNQYHYKSQEIEPIELMRANFSEEEFSGFLQGNVLKYMLRYKDKNGVEDLKKAKTYLTWLIKEDEK